MERKGTPVDAGWFNRDGPRSAKPYSALGPTVFDELFIAGTISNWKPSLVDRLHHVRRLIERQKLGHAFEPSDARKTCEVLAETLFALVRCMDREDLELLQKNTGMMFPVQVAKQVGEAWRTGSPLHTQEVPIGRDSNSGRLITGSVQQGKRNADQNTPSKKR